MTYRPILCDIYEEMNPNNFGRLIAYLTLVYKIADSYEEEIVREAVQRTVENLKHIDLEKYKVGCFISFKALLGQLLIDWYLHILPDSTCRDNGMCLLMNH